MLEDSSTRTAFEQQVYKQLAQTLGQTFSEQEFSDYFKHIEILKPTLGQQFWKSTGAIAGVYIVVIGKVRLLDDTANLIISLGTGEAFGQLTLFPEASFQPYSARASTNLTLCYISNELLQILIRTYPTVQTHLYRQATFRDLLLRCHQTSLLANMPLEGLNQLLFLLESHTLERGELPHALLRSQKFWLLRQGELVQVPGKKLGAGGISAFPIRVFLASDTTI